MKLSNDELQKLRSYKADTMFDDVRMKEVVKKNLLENKLLLYLLNNKELQEAKAEADEYFGVNILPYYLIKPTQVETSNFVCFETAFDTVSEPSKKFKDGRLIFTIICDHEDLVEKTVYCPRHDLIASVLIEQFNETNDFGFHIQLVSDEPSVLDDNYACRTLIFELTTFNNIPEGVINE